VADLLSGTMNENSANAMNLRNYLVDLAATKEAELKIADEEAQRCRSSMIKRPPSAPKKGATK
jgi:hypothetical protein